MTYNSDLLTKFTFLNDKCNIIYKFIIFSESLYQIHESFFFKMKSQVYIKYVFKLERKENQNGSIISLLKGFCNHYKSFRGGLFNHLVGIKP